MYVSRASDRPFLAVREGKPFTEGQFSMHFDVWWATCGEYLYIALALSILALYVAGYLDGPGGHASTGSEWAEYTQRRLDTVM